MGLGVGFLKRLEKGAYVNLQSGISINNSMLLRGTFAAPELWRGMLQVDATAQWLDVNDVSFYGLGQDSAQGRARAVTTTQPMELGAQRDAEADAFRVADRQLHVRSISTRIAMRRSSSEADAPGLDQDADLPRHARHAHVRLAAGRRATARAAVSIAPRSSATSRPQAIPYSFNAQEYEVVQQVPLVREQFVLAGRALMTLTQPDAGHDVPVIMAPYLGSGSTLRGFANSPLHGSQSRAADRRIPLASVALSRHGDLRRRRTGRARSA